MSFETVIVKKINGVAWITLNRPQVLNAINMQLAQELDTALRQAAADEEIRVVVVNGAGRAFCAGADVKEMGKEKSILELREEELKDIERYSRPESIPKPVIAAVHGYALGGGCELALACDITIASEDAKFGQPEINIGLMPGGGATQRLSRLVGVKKAKELILTGDIIDAREAERIGLVCKVVPQEQLKETVLDIARKIASKSPVSIRLAKLAINKSMETHLRNGLEYEAELFNLCSATDDHKEAVNAFAEKRKPIFKGK